MFIENIVQSKNIVFEYDSYLYEIVKLINSNRSTKVKSFFESYREDQLFIIGEMRKFTPDIGMSNSAFSIEEMAHDFTASANAISIFTENHTYKGEEAYISAVHKITDTPILKRDLIISPIEIFYAKRMGASAVTLISNILNNVQLREFIKIIKNLKMEAVVEVQNETELERALKAKADNILINTINYSDFTYEPNLLRRLRHLIPPDIRCLAECRNYFDEEINLLTALGINIIVLSTDIFNVHNRRERIETLRKKYNRLR